MTRHLKLADEYYAARANYDRVHALSSQAHSQMKEKEYALVEAMIEAGVTGFNRDDGTAIRTRKAINVSVTQDNNDAIREWLMDVEGDDTDYLETKVSKKALSEKIRGDLAEGNAYEDDYPEFLKLSTRPGLSVTGWNQLDKANL